MKADDCLSPENIKYQLDYNQWLMKFADLNLPMTGECWGKAGVNLLRDLIASHIQISSLILE